VRLRQRVSGRTVGQSRRFCPKLSHGRPRVGVLPFSALERCQKLLGGGHSEFAEHCTLALISEVSLAEIEDLRRHLRECAKGWAEFPSEQLAKVIASGQTRRMSGRRVTALLSRT
jgi:hypothetical protein